MKIGVALPRLKRCTGGVIALAKLFDVVTPIDWLCPSTLVFDGVTTQRSIISQMQSVRGHCLVPAKPNYMPTLWGGLCRGKHWKIPKQQLTQQEKLAVIEGYITQTIQRFPEIREWDLVAGNVRADRKLRIPEWEKLLDRAIIANPRNTYWLDELLCTSYKRWAAILAMTANENIAGVGIQIHANRETDIDRTLQLLERVLALASQLNTAVNLSEVGYWGTPNQQWDEGHVTMFATGVRQLGELYRARCLVWWGLVPMMLLNHVQHPYALALYDRELQPTFLHSCLLK